MRATESLLPEENSTDRALKESLLAMQPEIVIDIDSGEEGPFSYLPDEVIQNIFKFLKPSVLFLMISVSKKCFNNVAALVIQENYWYGGWGDGYLKEGVDTRSLTLFKLSNDLKKFDVVAQPLRTPVLNFFLTAWDTNPFYWRQVAPFMIGIFSGCLMQYFTKDVIHSFVGRIGLSVGVSIAGTFIVFSAFYVIEKCIALSILAKRREHRDEFVQNSYFNIWNQEDDQPLCMPVPNASESIGDGESVIEFSEEAVGSSSDDGGILLQTI